ncbi:hypothetical protein GCM10009828_015730 [Actinoplanes couchii]|uniref:Uncharacterized protein n=1 Tax=Actinoplanes couchii TaxID=403638 RepID=A0ABQ3X468_9ACTN|nr:hypothetical protein Aco03nite_016880 [Actinoplanes couchii]
MLRTLGPGQQEPTDELPGEPDLHPNPGLSRLVISGRDQVVERPIQVSQSHIHTHPGDGQPLSRLPFRTHPFTDHHRTFCPLGMTLPPPSPHPPIMKRPTPHPDRNSRKPRRHGARGERGEGRGERGEGRGERGAARGERGAARGERGEGRARRGAGASREGQRGAARGGRGEGRARRGKDRTARERHPGREGGTARVVAAPSRGRQWVRKFTVAAFKSISRMSGKRRSAQKAAGSVASW